MQNKKLKKEYLRVGSNALASYGGNQGWLKSKALSGYGCGLIAGNDLVMYLSGETAMADIETYKARIKKERFIYPIINYFGIAGIMLAPSIKLDMIKHHLPYSVRWGVFPKNLRKTCEEMLENDIPVIFSVCQVFNFLWKPAGLQLYRKNSSGELVPCTRASSHYMTLTALDGDEMTVSSWGNKYYASWKEYEHLVRRRSFWVFSNIVKVTKK
ncbi:MAG: hypothetical protein MJ124_07815 [Lachnospiraceae bacterium]|nr:hypothetical protein [Lachnospiraceae bacterium]